MPIRFRCSYCNRLLGIATRKAGMQTTCPHCGNAITVPIPHDDGRTEKINLDDVDALLGNAMDGATIKEVAVAAPPAPPPPAPPKAAASPPRPPEVIEPEFEEPLSLPPSPPPAKRSPAKPPAPPAKPPAVAKSGPPPAPKPSNPKKPVDPSDPPLFEGDLDEILGKTYTPDEEERPKPPPVSGMDAMSLGDAAPRQINVSSGTATLLMAALFVLAAIAFAAGYLLAPKG